MAGLDPALQLSLRELDGRLEGGHDNENVANR